MKLQIDKILTIIIVLTLTSHSSFAQGIVSANVAEASVLEAGILSLQNEQQHQTQNYVEVVADQMVIDKALDEIKKWQGKINGYYQSGDSIVNSQYEKVVGYAAMIKNTTTFLHTGAEVIFSMADIIKATADNPEGVIAAQYMTKIYLKIIAEFLDIYYTYKHEVGTGGPLNMMSGADRCKLMWELEDRMQALSKDMHKLARCIRVYTMRSVWDRMSEPYLIQHRDIIANRCKHRWEESLRAASYKKPITTDDFTFGESDGAGILNWMFGVGGGGTISDKRFEKTTK